MTFCIVSQGPHGSTVPSLNPKLDAYRQMAWLQSAGRFTTLIAQADGSYTVQSHGLDSITFAPDEA